MLQPCTACQRHHAAGEASCPHCGHGAAMLGGRRVQQQGPWDRAVKRLKVGGLMAFTAVSASACYGPAMPPQQNALPYQPPVPTVGPSADAGATGGPTADGGATTTPPKRS